MLSVVLLLINRLRFCVACGRRDNRFWLPRSSVGARADAPASRGRTCRWSDRTAFPRWSVGTRGLNRRCLFSRKAAKPQRAQRERDCFDAVFSHHEAFAPQAVRCRAANWCTIEGVWGSRPFVHWCVSTRHEEWPARYWRGVVDGTASAATSYGRVSPLPPCSPRALQSQHEGNDDGPQVEKAAFEDHPSPLCRH